jgi:hypothetical protein
LSQRRQAWQRLPLLLPIFIGLSQFEFSQYL